MMAGGARQHSKGMVSAGQLRSSGDPARVDFGDIGVHLKKIRLNATLLTDNTETDTGFDLPQNSVVKDVFLLVHTAEATATTKTVDVGLLSSETAGDADGFLDGVSVASTGFVRGTLDSGGQTLGLLLNVDESGAGVLVPEPHIVSGSNAKSVTVTFGDAGGANELVADLYISYEAEQDL